MGGGGGKISAPLTYDTHIPFLLKLLVNSLLIRQYMQRNHIFTNIINGWRLEAKLEDQKYFYSFKEVDQILQNKKCYVIGRKGSGKSAICQHIVSKKDFNTFACKLSFKQFPFNILYELKDQHYSPSNQYITIWKFLIYSHVLKMMATNNAVEHDMKAKLESLFPSGSVKDLRREVSEWTKLGFGINILGSGGNVSVERSVSPSGLSWIDRIDIMEDIIYQYSAGGKYYVVFDELDEDYQDVTESKAFREYLDLLKGLFKAVQDIKARFKKEEGIHILPVVFLRNDIYSHIKDSDKTKWSDMMIELEWDIPRLKSLLAYRIYQDDPLHKGMPNFDTEWNRVFCKTVVKQMFGHTKTMNSFEYMANSTLLRPRDFIKYVKACCEEAGEKDTLISQETILRVDRKFSNYLLGEFKDELTPLLPDIERIFYLLSLQRQWIFSPEAFKIEYEKEVSNGNIEEKNVDFVLETLFNFSVIGLENKNQQKVHYFKYVNTNMTYNRHENIVLHRGLFKALGIV